MNENNLEQRIEELERFRATFEQQEKEKPGHAEVYTYLAERYGIGYDSLQVECVINNDGSATVIRTVTVTAHSELNEIDTFLLIPESAPKGKSWDMGLLEASSLTPNYSLSVKEGPKNSGKSSILLRISPDLLKNESMKYRFKEAIPPGLFAIDFTLNQLKKRKSTLDYFGWHINRPTKDLSLSVFFPVNYERPPVFGREVRYASASAFPSTRKQIKEQERIDTCRLSEIRGSYVLSLDVSFPMLGLIYMISWEPVPKRAAPAKEIAYEEETQNVTGLSAELIKELFETLISSGFFNSYTSLQHLFVDDRINMWQTRLPDANTPAGRVQALIYYLYNRVDENDNNALVLFLKVVADKLDKREGIHKKLSELATKLPA